MTVAIVPSRPDDATAEWLTAFLLDCETYVIAADDDDLDSYRLLGV